MTIIKIQNLCKTYVQGQGSDVIHAVKNVNLNIDKGEFISIVGRSGSGKTTLLNLIGGLEEPTKGSVEIDGEDVAGASHDEIAKFRRQKLGFIFQDFKLIPILTARENILMPMMLDERRIDDERLHELALFLGVHDYLNHFPAELSGGQKQRVAVARAFINRPSLILADEPTGNLDRKSSDEVMKLLKMINKRGCTILLVTHDDTYANMCNKMIRLVDGCITFE